MTVIYGNDISARPALANPSDQFVLVPTEEKWVFTDEGSWRKLPVTPPIDPADYVKFTDFATALKAGVVKVGAGLSITSGGVISRVDELPAVTAEDVGKVLKVNGEGAWVAGAETELPAVTVEDAGKILKVDAEGKWVAASAT